MINGLVYGFFTAVYLLFNQHYRLDGYVLGVWRGFGICLLFAPFLFFTGFPHGVKYQLLLAAQGLCIGIYDSRVFFASAKFGAGPSSRFMAVTVLITTFAWWLLTPQKFLLLVSDGSMLVTLMLILCGFCFCYWQMLRTEVSRAAALYTLPAVLALSAMSIITKYIADGGNSLWQGLVYYLTFSTFISGVYNLVCLKLQKKQKLLCRQFFSLKMLKTGSLLVAFSAVLIVAKTMALRTAPNPGYVTALLLVAPLFVYALNRHCRVKDGISAEAGFAMIFFLALLAVLVNGGYGVTD